MVLRVAIIGAGVSGMVTAKTCLEEAPSCLRVTVFEATSSIGGLWRFRHQVQSGVGSCMASTIVNSSKEMTTFSDFPAPGWTPNFMHNKWMIQYLTAYSASFNFQKYIRFRTVVESLTHLSTSTFSGYRLLVRDLESGKAEEHLFEAVAICTGHNHSPKMPPPYPGQGSFGGQILHSHAFRGVERFRGKKVVVVGVGNSGGDIAVELASIAEQVYLSSRRGGTWLVNRTGFNGYPVDTQAQTRLVESLLHALPFRLRCCLVETYVSRTIGHRLLGLRPTSTRFFSQHVMVNDYLPTTIHLGQVIMKPNIGHFTPTGVTFEGSERETKVDAVIFATGYHPSYPFLDQSTVQWNENGHLKLYKHVFDPGQPHPERLAFIGLTQPIGSLPPIAEIQARWFVGLLTGTSSRKLPSPRKMLSEIERRRRRIKERYGLENETRYTFQADWLPYMDSVGRELGVKPNLLKSLFTDPRLWWALLMKPAIPAQFRLVGPGAKRKLARELIFSVRERIKGPYKEVKAEL